MNPRQYSSEMFMTRRGFNNRSGLLNRHSGLSQYIQSPSQRQPSENFVQQTFMNQKEVEATLDAMDDEVEIDEVPEDAQIDLPEDTPMQDGGFSKLPEESI